MAETVASQDNILHGAYINFLTNAPLVITPENRGVKVIKNTYTIWNDLNTFIWQQINSKTWNELKIYEGE